MRLALAWAVLVISVFVFIAALAAMWRHRAHAAAPVQSNAFVESVWATVPWLIVALSAAPAVQRILAAG